MPKRDHRTIDLQTVGCPVDVNVIECFSCCLSTSLAKLCGDHDQRSSLRLSGESYRAKNPIGGLEDRVVLVFGSLGQ